MKYFRNVINDILRYASSYGGDVDTPNSAGKSMASLRVNLLKVLYNLLMVDAIPIKQLTSEKSGHDK